MSRAHQSETARKQLGKSRTGKTAVTKIHKAPPSTVSGRRFAIGLWSYTGKRTIGPRRDRSAARIF
jgi:hypothetical protein